MVVVVAHVDSDAARPAARGRDQRVRAAVVLGRHVTPEPCHTCARANAATPERTGRVAGAGRTQHVADLVDPAVAALVAIRADARHEQPRGVGRALRARAVVLERERADAAADEGSKRRSAGDRAALAPDLDSGPSE